MKKRILAAVLALTMVFSLAACKGEEKKEESAGAQTEASGTEKRKFQPMGKRQRH